MKLKAYYCLDSHNRPRAAWAPSKAEAARILGTHPSILAVGGAAIEHIAIPYEPATSESAPKGGEGK